MLASERGDLWKLVPPLLNSIEHCLREVHLSNSFFVDNYDEIRQFFAACTASQTLENLFLWKSANYDLETINLAVELILQTKSLKKLRLCYHTDNPSVDALAKLANALKKNTSIQSLIIDRHHEPLQKEEITGLGDLLKGQYTLQEFEVREKLDWPTEYPADRTTIDFYLSLNMKGRGYLLGKQGQRQSIEAWISISVLAHQEPSFLYYYLRCDPSIFFFPGPHHQALLRYSKHKMKQQPPPKHKAVPPTIGRSSSKRTYDEMVKNSFTTK